MYREHLAESNKQDIWYVLLHCRGQLVTDDWESFHNVVDNADVCIIGRAIGKSVALQHALYWGKLEFERVKDEAKKLEAERQALTATLTGKAKRDQ